MALTELETKILKGVVSAEGGRLTIEELASKVGCAPDTIYNRLTTKQEFQQLFKEALVSSLTGELPKVMNSLAENAKGGSYKHQKLLLELTEVYTEKKDIRADIGIREAENPFKDDNERQKFLKETLGEILSGGDS